MTDELELFYEKVEDLEIGRADLEDVFLEIMQRETLA